jgi:hypothetical protein
MYCIGGHLGFTIGKNVSKRFFSEATWTIETKLPRNDHWKVLYKVSVIYADRISKTPTTSGHRLTLDPMGKCSNAFFRHFEFHIGTKNVVCREPSNEHSCTIWL